LAKVASISEKIGEVKTAYLFHPPAELRRSNRIKTIQFSLEIEGNTMTVEQVTALINNKRVLAPEKDILEVKNAIATYEQIDSFISKRYFICNGKQRFAGGN
jgi:Fic family protein